MEALLYPQASLIPYNSKKFDAYWGEDEGDDHSGRSPEGLGDPRG